MKKKVILITGASSGMGKDAAIELAKQGHIVYGAARRVEKMKELEKAGGKAIKLDVTKDDELSDSVNKIISAEGRIDVLINNAGFGLYGAMEDISPEDVKYQFDVNVFAVGRITQLILPHMRDQKSGRIINISSMGGRIYTPLGTWYHATKHALEGWSDALRLELKQFGIEVVVIEPGIIETEFGDVLLNPMMERSGTGPYANLANSVASSLKSTYEKGGSSPVSTITKVILRAVNSKKPKTRYVKGKFAKPMMWIRKYMGDRIFDRIIMSQVK